LSKEIYASLPKYYVTIVFTITLYLLLRPLYMIIFIYFEQGIKTICA